LTDPKQYLKDYLDTLVRRYLYIKSLRQELAVFDEWIRNGNGEFIKSGDFFFGLARYSFGRMALLELCKFTSTREERSIYDWLQKARSNSATIGATRHVPGCGFPDERKPVSPEEYSAIVSSHLKALDECDDVIRLLTTHRDKVLAHNDKDFFLNPSKIMINHPLHGVDIDRISTCIEEILRDQHVLIMESAIFLEVSGFGKLNSVLDTVRSYRKIIEDEEIMMQFGRRILEEY